MLMHIYEFSCVVRGGTISTLFQITRMKLITKRTDDFVQGKRGKFKCQFHWLAARLLNWAESSKYFWMEFTETWHWDSTQKFTIFLRWGSKLECLEWSHTTAMIMMTVGIMTRTLYYTTGGESTVCHRGGLGSNPNQFMWDLFWRKK
jgi:hypothetical protein